MLTKTNVMFYLGAVNTAIAVRMFANPFVSPELAKILSIEAGLIFAVFAFASTVKRGLWISALTLLWGAGLFYFLDFRRDAVGFAVMATCGVIAYLSIRPLRRNRETGPRAS